MNANPEEGTVAGAFGQPEIGKFGYDWVQRRYQHVLKRVLDDAAKETALT